MGLGQEQTDVLIAGYLASTRRWRTTSRCWRAAPACGAPSW